MKIASEIRIALALALLLCLASMPYGYYILVRYGAAVIFGVMAYRNYEEKKNGWAVAWGALAFLFQPVLKIELGRDVWNVLDILIALYLLWDIYRERKNGDMKM